MPMENRHQLILIIILFALLPNFIFSQETIPKDPEFEEFKAMKKKEKEEREKKNKQQEYQDYLEFQEFKKKKTEEIETETEYDKKKKLGKIAYSPWAVQYSAGSGLLGGTRGEYGTTGSFLVVGEYHVPTEKFGFRVGVSTWDYSYSNNKKYERDLILSSIFVQGNVGTFFLGQYFLNERKSVSATSADFIVDYHFRPRKFFDPYIFAGFGIGGCENKCSAAKISAGVGFRINIKAGYFLTELIGEKPYYAFSNEYRNGSISNLHSAGFRVGFGIFL